MTTAGNERRSIPPMSHSFTPLPQHQSERGVGTGRVVLWVVLIGVAFWPRLWIIGFWIFGRQIGDAFSGWVVPALGFLFLPWTTLLYAWMWSISSDGVNGREWIVVAIGLISDLVFWVAGRRSLH
jgi:hypothetical protein